MLKPVVATNSRIAKCSVMLLHNDKHFTFQKREKGMVCMAYQKWTLGTNALRECLLYVKRLSAVNKIPFVWDKPLK